MIRPNAFGMKVIAISTLPENTTALFQCDPATGDVLIYNMNGDLVERISRARVQEILDRAMKSAFSQMFMSHGYTVKDNSPSLSANSEITGRELGRITRK